MHLMRTHQCFYAHIGFSGDLKKKEEYSHKAATDTETPFSQVTLANQRATFAFLSEVAVEELLHEMTSLKFESFEYQKSFAEAAST